MKTLIALIAVATFGLTLSTIAMAEDASALPDRTMNVKQGIDEVFEKPVGQILPNLKGAAATGENGRIGSAFVFWGYTLADGSPAFLFACAKLNEIECEPRIEAICTKSTKRLTDTTSTTGKVRYLACRDDICMIGPAPSSDGKPCCAEEIIESPLDIGLVQCQ